jgi:hypothetical protein
VKAYLAGASAEADAVAGWMARVREAGLEVTCDWPADIKANLAAGKPDASLTDAERAAYAEADLDGIASADIFWLLAPEPGNNSTGCWLELGHALALQAGLTVVASGPGRKRCIFVALADHQFETHAEAFEFIRATVDA